MNYKTAIVLALLFTIFAASIGIGIGVYHFLSLFLNPPKASANQQVACARDTFMCPNGQSVSRVKPVCQFAQCPKATSTASAADAVTPPRAQPVTNWSVTGTVIGKSILISDCPPENSTAGPECEPKGIIAEITAYGVDGKEVEKISTSVDGTFSMSLPVGNYLLKAKHPSFLAKCEDTIVSVRKNDSSLLAVSCRAMTR